MKTIVCDILQKCPLREVVYIVSENISESGAVMLAAAPILNYHCACMKFTLTRDLPEKEKLHSETDTAILMNCLSVDIQKRTLTGIIKHAY